MNRVRTRLMRVQEARKVSSAGGRTSGIDPQPLGHPPYGRRYAPPDPEDSRSWDEELEALVRPNPHPGVQ